MVGSLGFILSIAGATLGIVGALMMARSYHPFSLLGFAKRGIRIIWKLVRKGRDQVIRDTEILSMLGAINDEKRSYSLLGLYLVFLGFCLQLLGTTVSFIASLCLFHR